MGMCFSFCCEKDNTPDPETRRRDMAAAAERRLQNSESRGVTNPDELKRKQRRRDLIEKQAEMNGDGEAILKWQVN